MSNVNIAAEFKELYEAKRIGDLVRVIGSLRKIIDWLNGLNLDLDRLMEIIEAIFDSIMGGAQEVDAANVVEVNESDVQAAYQGQALQQAFDIAIILKIVNFVMKLIAKFNQS